MRVSEISYIARDNTIELALYSNGALITHNGITRCQVLAGSTLLDSSVTPALFDMTNADRIILSFGTSGLVAGNYSATLYVFDVNTPNGLRWDEFLLTVSS